MEFIFIRDIDSLCLEIHIHTICYVFLTAVVDIGIKVLFYIIMHNDIWVD